MIESRREKKNETSGQRIENRNVVAEVVVEGNNRNVLAVVVVEEENNRNVAVVEGK